MTSVSAMLGKNATLSPIFATISNDDYNDSSMDYESGWYTNDNSILVVILETLLYIIMAIVISCSAILVIMVVWRTSALHNSPGFLMIIMSICDLLLSIILAAAIASVVTRRSVYPEAVNISLAIMFATFQNGNAMALMVSALDQLVSILKPLQYPTISTPKRILTVFVVMLLLSVAFVVVLAGMAYKYVNEKKDPEINLIYYDDLTHLQFLALYEPVPQYMALWFFIIPGIVVLICYALIFSVVVKQRQQIRRMQDQMAQMSNRRGSAGGGMQILSHIKACRMLFVVTFIYFLGFMPYNLLDRYINSELAKPKPELPPRWCYKLSTWLIMAQSLLNCAIFYKMNKTFKGGMRKFLKQLPLTKYFFSNFRSEGATLMTHATANGHFPSFSNSARHHSLLGMGGTPRPSVQIQPGDDINPRDTTL